MKVLIVLVCEMCLSNTAVVFQLFVAIYICEVMNGIVLIIVMYVSCKALSNISDPVCAPDVDSDSLVWIYITLHHAP